jgi:hypothetical protein
VCSPTHALPTCRARHVYPLFLQLLPSAHGAPRAAAHCERAHIARAHLHCTDLQDLRGRLHELRAQKDEAEAEVTRREVRVKSAVSAPLAAYACQCVLVPLGLICFILGSSHLSWCGLRASALAQISADCGFINQWTPFH